MSSPSIPNNSTVNNATSQTAPLAMPTDASSLIALLFSFTALRDWLKLIVIGGLLETCRRLASSIWRSIMGSFFITAQFQEDDSCFEWMMVWLSKQPSWSKAREVQVSTQEFGLNSPAIVVPGEEDDPNALNRGRTLAYLPTISSTYSFLYQRRWMTVTRVKNNTGFYGKSEETLEISILARDRSFLDRLLLEAKKEYMAAQEHTICVYVSDTSNNWRHVACRQKRPLRSIILDPGIKDLLIDDARDFLDSKAWYSARGIPFRRGYLLYGAPGSGKTSLIHSLAGELGLHVYIISLSRVGLDDTSLSELVSALPEKCIALMEDIDAAFTHGLSRDAPAPPPPSSTDESSPPTNKSQPPTTQSRISLSGLLNALDGVGAQEGRILFATTNKYSSLDAALCRPGRMDLHVKFELASKYQAGELFKCFYLPSDDATEANDDESEKDSLDSGYGSVGTPERDLIDLDPADEKSVPPSPVAAVPQSTSAVPSREASAPIYSGSSHRARAPQLSRRQISDLAADFAQAIPERELSMASLQGYLMVYKVRPLEAAKDARAWVEKELADRVENQKGSSPSQQAAEKKLETPSTEGS